MASMIHRNSKESILSVDRHRAEMERLRAIGQRLHLLEKELVNHPHSLSAACVGCITDTIRTIPFCSIFAWVAATYGLHSMWMTHDEVHAQVTTLFVESEAVLLLFDELRSFVAFAMAIHTIVLLQAFAQTGVTREWLFGRHHEGCITCVECLLGACTGHFVLVFLTLLFFAMFALMMVSVPCATGLAIVKSACESSKVAQEGVTSAMIAMAHVDAGLIRQKMDAVCAQDSALLAECGLTFSRGIILTVFGEAALIVCASTNLEKVLLQKDYDEADKTEREIIAKFREARGETTTLDAM